MKKTSGRSIKGKNNQKMIHLIYRKNHLKSVKLLSYFVKVKKPTYVAMELEILVKKL
jgi:hypothetical protein